jgi:hypothetical protein
MKITSGFVLTSKMTLFPELPQTSNHLMQLIQLFRPSLATCELERLSPHSLAYKHDQSSNYASQEGFALFHPKTLKTFGAKGRRVTFFTHDASFGESITRRCHELART